CARRGLRLSRPRPHDRRLRAGGISRSVRRLRRDDVHRQPGRCRLPEGPRSEHGEHRARDEDVQPRPRLAESLGQGDFVMRSVIAAIVAGGVLFVQVAGASEAPRTAQATGGTAEKSSEAMPGKAAMGAVTVRGSISAIDKEKGTVTLKGPKGRT